MIARVGELAAAGSLDYAGVAFIVGRSGRIQPDALLAVEKELQQMHENAKILFLDAPDDVLIRRFEGNRRRHPFPAPTLADSITGERALLQSIRDAADLVIDTGSINTNQLRSRIVEHFTQTSGGGTMRVSLVSFGYSNGIPRDVDLVFDCRFSLLEWQIPEFAKEGKSYLSIAIGCTGGRHRSVAIAEEIRNRLNIENAVFHRDIAR